MLPVVYLHGFASSPQSSKARYFAGRLGELGCPVAIPALDEGDFEHLTISGMLRMVEAAVEGRRVALVGSSLGGYLAALYAARHPEEVEKLVLMAPAFYFGERWRVTLGADPLEQWRISGWRTFPHWGEGRDRQLHYGFIEDAERFEPAPDFRQPALVCHGRRDTVVPVEYSREYAAERENVTLIEYDSGHELTDVIGEIWREAACFLGAGPRE